MLVDAEDLEETDPAERAAMALPESWSQVASAIAASRAKSARRNLRGSKAFPFSGSASGMQVATIEFARNVCGLDGANSTEFEPHPLHPVIDLLETQKDVTEKGASMRLGTWPTKIAEGTRAAQVYGSPEIRERHRHRYEFNMNYREQMEEKGFVIHGTSPDGELVELIELKDHPWFLACQFHPEFQSKPNQPHPLFKGFVTACLAHGS